MRILGEQELVRVFAKHEPYADGHLGDVTNEMRRRGAPTINVIEWRGEFYATEGSHRLAAAHHLGLFPALIVSTPDHIEPGDEDFWERVKTTLPHYAWLRSTVAESGGANSQAFRDSLLVDDDLHAAENWAGEDARDHDHG
jgi:hypothetical protein